MAERTYEVAYLDTRMDLQTDEVEAKDYAQHGDFLTFYKVEGQAQVPVASYRADSVRTIKEKKT